TNRAGDKIAAVPEQRTTRGASRYDAIIATLVGLCAVCVSGYTAYVQRQQVRAAVWPILEFGSGNAPDIPFTLAKKGVGPAVIRNVIVKVDGQPVKNWYEVLDRLVGPGKHPGSENDMSSRVVAPGEVMTIFAPFEDGKPIAFDKSNPLWVKMNKERERLTVEICYSSTLGECWTLRAGGPTSTSTTVETRRCPSSSAASFQQ